MNALGGMSAARGRRRIVALAVVGALVVGAVAPAATASAGKKGGPRRAPRPPFV